MPDPAPGEAKPLFTDLFFPSLRLLVEAKGSVERGAIRMALAQLLDCSRFIDNAADAVLLPERPRQDLVDFVLRYGMQLIFPDGEEFVHEVRQEGRDIFSSVSGSNFLVCDGGLKAALSRKTGIYGPGSNMLFYWVKDTKCWQCSVSSPIISNGE